MCREIFFEKAKNDQFMQPCSKKGHKVQFLGNFSMNLNKKNFSVCRENFLESTLCVAKQKSLEDTDLEEETRLNLDIC